MHLHVQSQLYSAHAHPARKPWLLVRRSATRHIASEGPAQALGEAECGPENCGPGPTHAQNFRTRDSLTLSSALQQSSYTHNRPETEIQRRPVVAPSRRRRPIHRTPPTYPPTNP